MLLAISLREMLISQDWIKCHLFKNKIPMDTALRLRRSRNQTLEKKPCYGHSELQFVGLTPPTLSIIPLEHGLMENQLPAQGI